MGSDDGVVMVTVSCRQGAAPVRLNREQWGGGKGLVLEYWRYDVSSVKVDYRL